MAWKRQDYLNKYQPLLYLLSSDGDLDALSTEPGYCHTLGREHRHSHLNLLRSYLLELEADFRALYHAATPQALEDEFLAMKLVETEEVLRKIIREVKLQLWISRFIPVPSAKSGAGFFRRALIRTLPKNTRAQSLLIEMDSIERQIATTFG
jgi:hypothetical protein